MKKLCAVLALLMLMPTVALAENAGKNVATSGAVKTNMPNLPTGNAGKYNVGKKRIPVCNRIVNAKDYQVTAVRNDPASGANPAERVTIEITKNDCLPSSGGDSDNPWTFFVNGQEVQKPKVSMKVVDEVSNDISEEQVSYQIRNVDGAFVLHFIGSFTKR